jgi:nitrogen-specific signal transduction histidine kinase
MVAKLVGDHGGLVEYDRLDNPPRTTLRVLLPTAADA